LYEIGNFTTDPLTGLRSKSMTRITVTAIVFDAKDYYSTDYNLTSFKAMNVEQAVRTVDRVLQVPFAELGSWVPEVKGQYAVVGGLKYEIVEVTQYDGQAYILGIKSVPADTFQRQYFENVVSNVCTSGSVTT